MEEESIWQKTATNGKEGAQLPFSMLYPYCCIFCGVSHGRLFVSDPRETADRRRSKMKNMNGFKRSIKTQEVTGKSRLTRAVIFGDNVQCDLCERPQSV
jgi:hypothetical protein